MKLVIQISTGSNPVNKHFYTGNEVIDEKRGLMDIIKQNKWEM